ncbi:hypothetical protein KPSA1_03611 [Pseudomonas syringae pv. actinidiae]|uniref:Uncharacterized protein n=1 Tax=Pseudomonas syringae pv. actinidiae TaxID=103796 RepID=A0A2V0QB38_PSESF|nr:hypothetical protein KPSA1_03611 [Pseudomonas syringae pv. actinidiae]
MTADEPRLHQNEAINACGGIRVKRRQGGLTDIGNAYDESGSTFLASWPASCSGIAVLTRECST